MKNLIKICSDVYGVEKRLKRIDKSYLVYFNTISNKYEVHSSAQQKNTFCFSLPYEILDERALDWALKTRSQNIDEILKEIDKENLRLYEKMIKENVEILKEML